MRIGEFFKPDCVLPIAISAAVTVTDPHDDIPMTELIPPAQGRGTPARPGTCHVGQHQPAGLGQSASSSSAHPAPATPERDGPGSIAAGLETLVIATPVTTPADTPSATPRGRKTLQPPPTQGVEQPSKKPCSEGSLVEGRSSS